ncbi:MAG: sodium:solute symporter family protein [Hyphomicrobiaceae bacterium]
MSSDLLIWLSGFSLLYVVLLIMALRSQPSGPASQSNNLTEFFVSGRDLGLAKAVATLGATEIGLITIAYNAQKGFNEGFAAFHIGIAAFVGCAIVGLTGFVVAPMRRTGVLTLPEYYGQRFGQDVRVLGATIMALGGILNMGLFLKVASLFIIALLGVDAGSQSVTALMVVLVVIAVVYTCYGGMRSVITTDVFQFVLMVVGIVAAIVFLLQVVPLQMAVEAVTQKKGDAGFNPLENENFGMTYVMWMVLVAGVVSSAIWPTALSRALCIEREENVPRAYLIASLVFAGRMILPAFLGVLAFAYFSGQANPDASSLTAFGKDADLVATAVVLGEALPVWLAGFLAVAMFASFMSTQDGYLFCWSSIISRDIVGPLTGKTENANFQILATRVGIVLIAVYELYWGLIYGGEEDIWDYLAVSGSIYFCSGIVLLAGGLYWKNATRWGALLALLGGFTAIAALGPVKAALGLEAYSAPLIGFSAIAISLTGLVVGSIMERLVMPT